MYPRFIERRVREALTDTRVVMICGARQSGKTTLAAQISDQTLPFFTLDELATFRTATTDPVGFIREHDRAVIDEVQRVPELIPVIKVAVDTNPVPGRFLLTGSANLMTVPHVSDSLAGRIETVHLMPLAQSEIQDKPSSFLKQVFSGQAPSTRSATVGKALVEVVLAGGYPEAISRLKWERRQRWHLNYINSIIQRDIRSLARIEQLNLMPKFLRILAEHSGQLVNYSKLGSTLDMSHVTTRKYIGIFENLFLVHTLQPWYTNTLKRLVKTPKLHFLDAGLLAALKGITPKHLHRDRSRFGPILETFVFGELMKLAGWADDRYDFWHFRDKEKNEVDIVIENGQGQVVGIEVKAAATIAHKDFAGLRRLAADCGDRFVLGLVLYDHEYTLPFGDRMYVAPISTLWE